MPHPYHTHTDPRDHLIPAEGANATPYYVMYSVFRTAGPPRDPDTVAMEKTVLDAGVSIRGWYDIGGFRADADLVLWTLASDPYSLQAAYHALRGSGLGRDLESIWSCIGTRQPAEFSHGHTPACLSGVTPRPWTCVYPFVRSYKRYYMDEERRFKMLTARGRMDREHPDVLGPTASAFALNDYEWLLAFETDKPHHLTDAMRYQHGAEARLHVCKKVPFFTSPRVTLEEWVYRQPRSREGRYSPEPIGSMSHVG